MVTNGLLIILGLLMITGGLALSSAKLPDSTTLAELVRGSAIAHGVPPKLAAAIVSVESGWDPDAISEEDSYGLMQVLCRPDGRGGCENRFNVAGWPPRSAEKLLDPTLNVAIGMQILAYNISRYGLWRGVAVYNDWGARHDPVDGPYRNAGYVRWVRTVYHQLGGTG